MLFWQDRSWYDGIIMTDNRHVIGIVGGGSVGLVYAACLSKNANVVVKTRRQKQAVRIKNEGICLLEESAKEVFTGIDASADPSVVRDCDVVLVAVKSYDTATTA